MKRILTLFIFLFTYNITFTQVIDTVFGNPKYVKEKVIFLTSIKNIKLFYSDGDYGHSGFVSPEFTRRRFNRNWFETPHSHYINNERLYDKNRNLISERWFTQKDSLLTTIKYKYDSLNRVIEKNDSGFVTYLVDEMIDKYYYSGKNNQPDYTDRTAIVYSYTEDTTKKFFRQYPNSFPTITEYDAEKKIESKYILTNKRFVRNEYWDSCMEETYVDKCLKIDSFYHKELSSKRYFDDRGNLVKHEEYESGFDYAIELKRTETNVYDEQNRVIAKNVKKDSLNNIISGQFFEYNDEGLLNKQSVFFSGKLYEYLIYDYNNKFIAKGELVSYLNESEEKNFVTYKYKFDHNNNWIEIIKNVNGTDLFKWIREIEYY